jgi:O-antigen/teichoic acid export membrane protein
VSSVRTIAKNSIFLAGSSALNLVLGFFYAVYAARYLGAEGYGTIAFALSLCAIFGVLMDLGLGQLAIRDISRNKSLSDKYFFNIITFKFILVFLTLLLIVVFMNVISPNNNDSIKVVYIIALSTSLASFNGAFGFVFQSHEKMEYNSIGTVLNGIIMLLGALLAINQRFSVIGFAFIYLIANIVNIGYSFIIFATKFFKTWTHIDLVIWKPLLIEALPFGFTGLFVSMFYWLATIMLSYTKGNEVVGWYNAAYRLIMILLILPQILNIALFPAISNFYVNSVDKFRFIQLRSFKYMVVLALPIGVGTTILADRIILMIFGPAFSNSVIPLRILIWSTVIIFIGSPFSNLLAASNRQMVVAKITAFCAIEIIFLSLLIIPKFSYIGASFTTVASVLTSTLLSILATYRMGYAIPRSNLTLIMKVIFASGLMGIFVIYLGQLNLFLIIPAAAIFYFILSYLLSIFDKDDIEIIRNILIKPNINRTT